MGFGELPWWACGDSGRVVYLKRSWKLHTHTHSPIPCPVYLFHLAVPEVVWAKSFQSCPTFWDATDCSPQGYSVHGILQARILVLRAILSSRGSFQHRDQTCVSCLLHWQAGSLPQVKPLALSIFSWVLWAFLGNYWTQEGGAVRTPNL